MTEKARHVLDRLPQHRAVLLERMMVDPEFRALCEDYGDALEALGLWEVSTDRHRAARVKEFRALIEELEHEIVAELGAQ